MKTQYFPDKTVLIYSWSLKYVPLRVVTHLLVLSLLLLLRPQKANTRVGFPFSLLTLTGEEEKSPLSNPAEI